MWYRALILEANSAGNFVKVYYVDYGNEEVLPIDQLRQIPMTFLILPAQVFPVEIEELKTEFPSKIEEFHQKVLMMQENWAVVFSVSFI